MAGSPIKLWTVLLTPSGRSRCKTLLHHFVDCRLFELSPSEEQNKPWFGPMHTIHPGTLSMQHGGRVITVIILLTSPFKDVFFSISPPF